jgi:hypothetical protein
MATNVIDRPEKVVSDNSQIVRATQLILLLGLLLSSTYYILVFVSSSYLHNVPFDAAVSFWSNDFPRPLPPSTYPVALGNHYFGDFLVPFRLAQQPSPFLAPGFVPFGYLPFAAVLIGPLTILNYWCAFSIFLVISVTLIVFSAWRALAGADLLSKALLLSVLVVSGPLINAVDRGNLGLLMVGLMCLGILAELESRRSLAGLLFGLAAAVKLYPVLFAAVFLVRSRWKSLGVMTATFAVCVAIPLLVYQGGLIDNFVAMKRQFLGSSNFDHAATIQAFNNSFYALFASMSRSSIPAIQSFGQFLTSHYYLSLTVVAAIAMFVVIHPHTSILSRMSSSCVVMVFVPNIVGSYVLLIMFVPLLFGVASISIRSVHSSLSGTIQVGILTLMLVPKGLPFPNPFASWSQTGSTYSSVLNPFLGLSILFVTFIEAVYKSSWRKSVN